MLIMSSFHVDSSKFRNFGYWPSDGKCLEDALGGGEKGIINHTLPPQPSIEIS
jgi:hypothetical protein